MRMFADKQIKHVNLLMVQNACIDEAEENKNCCEIDVVPRFHYVL